MSKPEIDGAFEAEYQKFRDAMASSPIYRALQTITQETTAVYEAIQDGIEGLCGLYLNHDERNAIVCDVSSTILESALRHGLEDSSLTFNVQETADNGNI